MAGTGIKPDALAAPVAGQDAESALNDQVTQAAGDLKPTRAPASAPQATESSNIPTIDPEALFQQYGGGSPSAPSGEAPSAPQAAQPAPANPEDLFKQFGGGQTPAAPAKEPDAQTIGTALRAKLSFAETPYERVETLKQAFPGAQIKKVGSGDLDYKVVTKDGQNYDLRKQSGFMDAVANHASTIAGITASFIPQALGIAGAPETGGASVVAGNALAATADKATRDAIARGLDIPLDPNRNLGQEHALNTALGMAFGATSHAIEQSLVDKYGAKAAQAIKDDAAFKSLQDTIAKAIAPDVRLQGQGILPEGNNLLLHEVAPNSGDALALKNSVQGSKVYNDALQERGENLAQGFQKVYDMIGNMGNSKMGLGDKFQNYVDLTDKATGEAIGKYRDTALKAAGDNQFPATNAKAAFDNIASKIGLQFDPSSSSLVLKAGDSSTPATAKDIADAIINAGMVKNDTEAKAMGNALARAGKVLNTNEGSQMDLGDMKNNREFFKNLYGNIRDSASGAYKYAISSLERGFRNDMDDVASKFVQPGEQDAYNAAKAKFGALQDAQDVLNKSLDQDNLSAKELAKNIFSTSTGSLDKIRAVRTLTEDNPDLWRDLVGNHLETILDQSGGDLTKAAGKLKGMDKEVLLEMAGGDQQKYQNLRDMFDIAERTSKTAATATDDSKFSNALKGLTLMMHGSGVLGAKGVAGKLYDALMSSQRAQDYVSGKPIEAILKGLPPSVQQEAKISLTPVLAKIAQNPITKATLRHALDPGVAQPVSNRIEQLKGNKK